ncbi:MAG: APC family permease, partial [Phycisphaerales bacterium]|nr:APC family permease [Phycisphaerales bacterium]
MAGIITSGKRPRNLTHWHAGPLLFGDWGTSRLYVLGLAFVSLGFAAPYYLVALSLLMVAVAWAYTIVCRSFPDGGGVYSAARQITPLLSVIGATLLLADYIVTAALSTVDGFHYFGVPSVKDGGSQWVIVLLCTGTIALLGAINWFGARAAGEFAKWVAVASIGLSAVIAIAVLPWVPEGLRHMHMDHHPLLTRWAQFSGIILALSGVEAVANMTGIMKEPVSITARKTIWPILAEVATLNLVFGIALVGLVGLRGGALIDPSGATVISQTSTLPYSADQIRDSAMKVLAIEGGRHWLGYNGGYLFGKATAVVFGLLLLSAANTVIGGMISVMYALGRDNELPRVLTRLNYSGVPKWPLLAACAAPALLL